MCVCVCVCVCVCECVVRAHIGFVTKNSTCVGVMVRGAGVGAVGVTVPPPPVTAAPATVNNAAEPLLVASLADVLVPPPPLVAGLFRFTFLLCSSGVLKSNRSRPLAKLSPVGSDCVLSLELCVLFCVVLSEEGEWR